MVLPYHGFASRLNYLKLHNTVADFVPRIYPCICIVHIREICKLILKK